MKQTNETGGAWGGGGGGDAGGCRERERKGGKKQLETKILYVALQLSVS